MVKDIKKQLSELWDKEPIQFHHFEFITEDKINKIINDIPKKYEKKSREQFPEGSSKSRLWE